ncbi:alpha/beta hydrolase [soil metagenome]
MNDDRATHPPFDVQVDAEVRQLSDTYTGRGLTIDRLDEFRAASYVERPAEEVLTRGGAVTVEELSVPPSHDRPAIDLVVLRPARVRGRRPLLFGIHGGGMMAGNKWDLTDRMAEWVELTGCLAVGLDYRLAPEFPHPYPVEDCYAALAWLVSRAEELGIESGHVVIYGQSAGGGLAAAVSLVARDRGFPAIAFQVLECPMLDDRMATPSSTEIHDEGCWDNQSNQLGWESLLGSARGTADVSPYAAPARATDLDGLPATYIDVGQVEVFRDEAIQFACRLTAARVPVELHVWPGACHVFDLLAPDADLSRIAKRVRTDYLRRAMLSLPL